MFIVTVEVELPDFLPLPNSCSTQNATRLLVLCTHSSHAPPCYLVPAAQLSHASFPPLDFFLSVNPSKAPLPRITHAAPVLSCNPSQPSDFCRLICTVPSIALQFPVHSYLYPRLLSFPTLLSSISCNFLSPLPDHSFRSLLLRIQNPLLFLSLSPILSASMAEEKSRGCYK
jgi:hypothetical protein